MAACDSAHGTIFRQEAGGRSRRFLKIQQKIIATLTEQCVKQESDGVPASVSLKSITAIVTSDIFDHVLAGRELQMHASKPSSYCDMLEVVTHKILLRAFSPVSYWKVPGLKNLDGLLDAKSAALEATRKLNENDGKSDDGSLVGRLKHMAHNGDLSSCEMADHLQQWFMALYALAPPIYWALFHLALLPELQEAIAMEMSLSQGEGKSIWAEALFLETIRFYPFELVSFQTEEHITLAGRQVPPRTKIMIDIHHILRHLPTSKLGDDLEEFRPARWVGPEGIIDAGPCNDMVFGYGPRSCTGQLIPKVFIPKLLAQIVKEFVLEATRSQVPIGSFPPHPPEDCVIRIWLRRPKQILFAGDTTQEAHISNLCTYSNSNPALLKFSTGLLTAEWHLTFFLSPSRRGCSLEGTKA